MKRRTFLKTAGLTGLAALAPAFSRQQALAGGGLILPKMKLTWQGHQTTRPFQADIDTEGKIWFGSSRFFCYDPETRTTKLLDNAPLEGKPFSTCLCQGDKVYALTQKSPFVYAYHRSTGKFTQHALPDPESNIWFGVRVPGDPRLYFYVRNRSKLVVWDTELDKGTEIAYPEAMDLWSGFSIRDDGALYSFTLDAKPCRLVRFDLKRQAFEGVVPAPEPDLEITGVNPVGQKVYCADRFTGRLFPYDMVHRTWGTPIAIPGHKTVFSFIGMGTSYRGKAYYCLSTYKGTMKWDFNKNEYLSKGDENIGIDGRPHHFMNKYLVFDPASGESGFLEAPAIPGSRYPLICYSIVCNDRLIITGYDLGDVDHGLAPMGTREGELLVFQSTDEN
jgi:hypothetical protein